MSRCIVKHLPSGSTFEILEVEHDWITLKTDEEPWRVNVCCDSLFECIKCNNTCKKDCFIKKPRYVSKK